MPTWQEKVSHLINTAATLDEVHQLVDSLAESFGNDRAMPAIARLADYAIGEAERGGKSKRCLQVFGWLAMWHVAKVADQANG